MKIITLKIATISFFYLSIQQSAWALKCTPLDLTKSIAAFKVQSPNPTILIGTFSPIKKKSLQPTIWSFKGIAYNAMTGEKTNSPKHIVIQRLGINTAYSESAMKKTSTAQYIALVENAIPATLSLSTCGGRLFFYNPKNRQTLEYILNTITQESATN
jgi:hypothetical protein